MMKAFVYSQGAVIWVSSTSFQKSSIGWPQQPPTEKVLKFNVIFCESAQNSFFSKHLNKAEFNDMDDSEVLRSDFSGFTVPDESYVFELIYL